MIDVAHDQRGDGTDEWLEDEPAAETQRLQAQRDPTTGGESPELETPAFPIVLRGYEREAVDLHMARLRRRIAELEAVRTPETVMRRALEQVGEETSSILLQAQETASDIAARSRAQADDRLERAKRDADEVRVSAEMRLRQLDADTDAVWRERGALIEDVRKLSSQLAEVVDRAERRYPAEEDTGAGGRSGAFDAIGEVDADDPADRATGARDPEAEEDTSASGRPQS